jgi:hypothetical protein
MMLLAGASRAVVPVPPLPSVLPKAEPDASALGGAVAADAAPAACAPACPSACRAASDELAALFELAEHPARNMPPPSRTLPIMRPATTPCLVFPGVFRMPL